MLNRLLKWPETEPVMIYDKNTQSLPPYLGSRLCVLRPAHLLFAIFNCITSIMVSFLHLGQKRGKLNIAVSLYTLVRVLESQTGQRIQRESFCSSHTILPLGMPLLCVVVVWLTGSIFDSGERRTEIIGGTFKICSNKFIQ